MQHVPHRLPEEILQKMRQAPSIRDMRKSSFELLLRFGGPVNVTSDTMTAGGSESMPAEVQSNLLQQR